MSKEEDALKLMKPGAPRYRLTQAAYIDDTYLDPEAQPRDKETGDLRPLVIPYEGIPGHFMEPVDEAAKAMKKKHPSNFVDPILQMTAVH